MILGLSKEMRFFLFVLFFPIVFGLILYFDIMVLGLHDIEAKEGLLVHFVVFVFFELLYFLDIFKCGIFL